MTPHFPIVAVAVFAVSSAAAAAAAARCITDETIAAVQARGQHSNHDLSLPDWGPYTKNYIGISHIPDVSRGVRFDLSIFPSIYRGKAFVPDVMFDTGFRPWRASPSLEFFEFRHDIEWKDRVFADIAYAEIDPCMRAIAVTINNNSALEQSVSLHFAASIHFPSVRPYEPNTPIRSASATVPPGAVWIDAVDYSELTFAAPGPRHNLVYDGWLRGEIREHGFVNGGGIGQGFGKIPGDRVRYTVDIPVSMQDAAMVLRYRTLSTDPATIHVQDLTDRTVSLPASDKLRTVTIPIGAIEAGSASMTLLPNSQLTVHGVVVAGNAVSVRESLASFATDPSGL